MGDLKIKIPPSRLNTVVTQRDIHVGIFSQGKRESVWVRGGGGAGLMIGDKLLKRNFVLDCRSVHLGSRFSSSIATAELSVGLSLGEFDCTEEGRNPVG